MEQSQTNLDSLNFANLYEKQREISIHSKLLNWYKIHGRETLPWRNTTNLYHIYVSEIMLQQTQVGRVMEYFYPFFLEKYPTLQALSDANIDDVLASWSGLGYYSRARNLHKTAQLCATSGLPHDIKLLQKLPGIGQYTASAICSFGLHQKVGVVDTNIARVLKRYFGLLEVKEKVVWEKSYQFLNSCEPTKHNLALMDLGSLICTPKNSVCCDCPLVENCIGKENPEIYTKTKKVLYENLELFYGVYIQGDSIALKKSTTKLYHGMLELPTVEPIEEDFIASFKHSYTKYRIVVKLYKIENISSDEVIFVNFEQLDQLPISTLTKKALNLV